MHQNHRFRLATRLACLLVAAIWSPACVVTVDSRAGKRIHPSPETSLERVEEGSDVAPAKPTAGIPPLSICVPEIEAPGPAGIDRTRGSVLLSPRPVKREATAVLFALVESLRKHRVDAIPLSHRCRFGSVKNGDTEYYVRPVVLVVERHYHPRPPAPGVPLRMVKTRRYQAVYGIALELLFFRQGGELLLESKQAGVVRLDDTLADDELLAVAMDRLVVGLLSGRLREVLR